MQGLATTHLIVYQLYADCVELSQQSERYSNCLPFSFK
jgi:hypothetical protein